MHYLQILPYLLRQNIALVCQSTSVSRQEFVHLHADSLLLSHNIRTACVGEAIHYIANLEGRVNVSSPSYCLSTAHGTLMGQAVAIIASGIGPGTAALCLMEVLQCRYDHAHMP